MTIDDKIEDEKLQYDINREGVKISAKNISQKYHNFLKTFNSEFQGIEVLFTDQNSQTLQIECRINLTLVIK